MVHKWCRFYIYYNANTNQLFLTNYHFLFVDKFVMIIISFDCFTDYTCILNAQNVDQLVTLRLLLEELIRIYLYQ